MKWKGTALLLIVVLLVMPVMVLADAPAGVWYVPGDFATIQEAIDSPSVVAGDTVFVGPGSHAGAVVTKSIEIRGEDGAVIATGPLHPSGLFYGFRMQTGSDGATISHLRFEGVDLAIMNGSAVDEVTITACNFVNTIQAISNWRGSGWTISHNDITDLRTRNGGGIGILIGDYLATEEGVRDNVVSHNKISGVLHVWEDDGGGYNGSGIVLYADFRWGMPGAVAISENRVIQNKISLVSDTPDVVDIAAIELTDSRDDPTIPQVVFDNSITFNDYRETTIGIVLTPESLASINDISRNLGGNRGQGPRPAAFEPGE